MTDLTVDKIERVDEDPLREETVLSLFGLENITDDNLEEKADQLRALLCSGIIGTYRLRIFTKGCEKTA